MYISAYIGGKPCGRQVFERNRDLECRIKQAFQVQGGCEMSVESVLSCLDFGPDIEITSWLVSVYDFYSRVVKDR